MALAHALEVNTTLTDLNLARNKIARNGAKVLAMALETNTGLSSLDLDDNGIEEVGYFAYINWYDDTYRHRLHCGTKKFHPNYLKQVVALANKIDQVK